MSAFASSYYKKVDENYHLDGGIEEDHVAFLAKECRSSLYLYLDDAGADEARQVLPKHFADNVYLRLNGSDPVYQVDTASRPGEAVAAYRSFEAALDQLARPVAIICKSANRASAVLAAYTAVRRNFTKEQAETYSKENGLKYLGSTGLVAWVNAVIEQLHTASAAANELVFRQLFEKESSTYTYLLADSVTKEALLIDPVLETVARDSQLVQDLGLTLKYVLNTHVHADHITGTGALKALHTGTQSVISAASSGRADVLVAPGQVLTFGSRSLTVLATPGHTEGCVSYLLDDRSKVFTGDAVLVRGCGRTDFQGGSATNLYHSIHTQIFTLPESTFIYPGHDYKGHSHSTVAEERALNPRLSKTLPEFVEIMDNLNLPYPAKFDRSVPANLVCGV